MTDCIACAFPVSYPMFRSEDQPLAAMHLPHSAHESRAVARYPMDFRACANCGHVFNAAFDYSRVPYENNTNLMYNTGSGWMEYMERLAARLTAAYSGTWLEIGCGDGNFLQRIGRLQPSARLVGFEPGTEADNAAKKDIEAVCDYFMPERDLPKYRPDVLVCRHVIEHLPAPRAFMAELAYWCNRHALFPVLLAEVPCIDKAVRHARINDYLYEHVSNFTQASFRAMFEAAGFEVLRLETGYDEEVVAAEVRARKLGRFGEIELQTRRYRERVEAQFTHVAAMLADWKAGGKTVAFWGGTGKSASFLNSFSVMAEDFPLVVDSDYLKVGRFVPRTAQEIRAPEYLNEHPANIIVITTQWRARDIYAEIQRRAIPYETVYVLLDQRLTPYRGETI